MPKKDPEELRKGSQVVATTDLRDVPAGTPGRVILVNGLTWIRYWVLFDNGVSLGSIPRADLAVHVRPVDREADDRLAQRAGEAAERKIA